jgi:hypothetical protein
MEQKPSPRKHKKQQRPLVGFYARRFTPTERDALTRAGGLQEEIGLMRILISGLFEITQEEAAGLEEWIKAVGALGTAAQRLARLMMIERKLDTGSDPAAQLREALSSLLADIQPEAENGNDEPRSA